MHDPARAGCGRRSALPHPILCAACASSDRHAICTGRHTVMEGRKPRVELAWFRDPARLEPAKRAPNQFLWPRPFGGETVWGESCQNGKHFDCISFVNYCVWQSTGLCAHHPDIARVRRVAEGSSASRALRIAELRAGDILVINGIHHIGLATGPGRMIHAKGEGHGVLEEPVYQADVVLRPTNYDLRNLWG